MQPARSSASGRENRAGAPSRPTLRASSGASTRGRRESVHRQDGAATIAASAHKQQQQPWQHAEQQRIAQQHAGQSSLLRHLLLAAAAAPTACLLLPWSTSAAGLPPLARATAPAPGAPSSSLSLSEPQLLPLPPRPVAFPRRTLQLNFAVLCLRSGYEAVDDCDFVPTDEYQKLFWKLRQAEWEPFKLQHAPLTITQGDLQNPLYFDFISFSQAASAGPAMQRGKQVFEEYVEDSEEKLVVTRDPSMSDNAQLPARWFERQGDHIYRGLVEGFQGVQYDGPLPCPPGADTSQLLEGVSALLALFEAQGYALRARVTPGGGGASFEVRLEGPANLWSLQALAARRSQLYSDHAAAAVAAYLRASGRSAACRIAWNDTAVTQQWSLA